MYTGTFLGALTEGVIAVHEAVMLAVTQLRTHRTQAPVYRRFGRYSGQKHVGSGVVSRHNNRGRRSGKRGGTDRSNEGSGTGRPRRVMAVSDTVSVATTRLWFACRCPDAGGVPVTVTAVGEEG